MQQGRHKRFVFILVVFFIFCFLQGTGGYGDEHNLAENNRTAGGIQIQGEEEISVELIEERERAIRQLEVSAVFLLQY